MRRATKMSRRSYGYGGGTFRSAPAGYSRAAAQRRGRRRASYRPFRPGFDRTGGFYGRFAGPGGEKKFFDTDVDDAVVSGSMTINNLTVVPEGNFLFF